MVATERSPTTRACEDTPFRHLETNRLHNGCYIGFALLVVAAVSDISPADLFPFVLDLVPGCAFGIRP